jgi:hypothetical protein
MSWMTYLVVLLIPAGGIWWYLRTHRERQMTYIEGYRFHSAIRQKLHQLYPDLNGEQLNLVFAALRDFFWMSHQGRRQSIAMPSKVVDDAWHEFILFTRSYKQFCHKALGRFLHHTPTEAMHSPTLAQEGIRRAWRLACAREQISPGQPGRLPLIFAIDAQLNIPGGFSYVLNCEDQRAPGYGDGYCATHINCATGCAGESADGPDGVFDRLFDSDCHHGCSMD